MEGQGYPARRVLKGISRFDELPAELMIERVRIDAADPSTGRLGVPAEYIFTAVSSASVQQQHAARILGILPVAPGPGLTVEEIVARAKLGRSTVQNSLRTLDGLVHRRGTGFKNDPHRYVRTDGVAGSPTPVGGQQQNAVAAPPVVNPGAPEDLRRPPDGVCSPAGG